MNKKGFTLIEVLSSIALIGMIATIASINIVKIFDNKNNESKKNNENIITTAACVYIELEANKNLKEECLNTSCEITTNDLINAGLLNEEDIEKTETIKIYSDNNEKKCIIN